MLVNLVWLQPQMVRLPLAPHVITREDGVLSESAPYVPSKPWLFQTPPAPNRASIVVHVHVIMAFIRIPVLGAKESHAMMLEVGVIPENARFAMGIP